MYSSKIIFVGVLFVVIAHLAAFTVSELVTNSTTVAPASQNSTKLVSLSVPGTNKSISLSVTKKESEEDCIDDEPVPEPEGKANATRQGKELSLSDKDKYSIHGNATAEPEPESEPGQNGTSLAGSKDKLTGANGKATTLPPSRGGAASFYGSSCLAFGLTTLSTLYMKISL